jgi:hypothetical protein
MDEIYNISAILTGAKGSEAMGGLARSTNTILGGYYYGWFIMFIVGLMLFLFLKSKGWQAMSCLTTAFFANVLIGWFLFAIRLINAETLWIAVLGLVACMFGMWLSNRE